MLVTDDKINRRFNCRTRGKLFQISNAWLPSNTGPAAAVHLRQLQMGNSKPSGIRTMAERHQVAINGNRFPARHGELLLDAALSNGIDLPYDCRAGHCGTCCVRLISGEVRGGEGAEPGIVHACQCRIVGDVVIERGEPSGVRSVEGVLSSLRPLSPDVMEVGISTERALPYRAGQYARVQFSGYPCRPYSMTHPLRSDPTSSSVWFHNR